MSATIETRRLQMHERLLFDVIRRQAGTIEKAMLEAAMNAADAGSTECSFSLTDNKLVIVDDGRGFEDKVAITKFFETFGQPPEEGEQKTYGYFRMGRGQLFSFGRNVWTSGIFQMSVDIKNRGLAYDLTTHGNSAHKGCKIEIDLYDELTEVQKFQIVRAFPRYVKYMPIAITLNGERLSVDLSKEKWDFVTDEAYIKLARTSQFHVYNQGAWVCDLYEHRYGTGGLVVSRKPLKINFARNDIMNDCPVWKKIREVVDTNAKAKNLAKENLSEGEMKRFAEQIRSGEVKSKEGGNIKLFTDVSGRNWSANRIVAVLQKDFFSKITFAQRYDSRGDRVHQQKLAFVLATETLERFDVYKQKDLLQIILTLSNSLWMSSRLSLVELDEVSKKCSERMNLIDNSKLRPRERVWQDILSRDFYLITCGITGQERARKVFVGDSDFKYRAWTDGSTYIAFDRKYLATLSFGMKDLCKALLTLTHEYCHDSTDSSSHAHSPEFYQQFHDRSDKAVSYACEAFGWIDKVLEKHNIKMEKEIARTLDRTKAVEKAKIKFEALAARLETPEAVPEPPKAEEGVHKPTKEPRQTKDSSRLYRGAYGILFEAAKDFDHKDAIISRAAKLIGKDEKLVKISYEVLRNPQHQSNGGRSKEETQADGKVRLISIRE